MGHGPLLLQDLLHPPGHGGHQRLQVVIFRHLCHPQPGDILLPLLNVGGRGLPQPHLHPGPGVLYGIEVWTVPWPLDQLDVGPVNHSCLCMNLTELKFEFWKKQLNEESSSNCEVIEYTHENFSVHS